MFFYDVGISGPKYKIRWTFIFGHKSSLYFRPKLALDHFFWLTGGNLLGLLVLQSRFGYKPLNFQVLMVRSQNWTAAVWGSILPLLRLLPVPLTVPVCMRQANKTGTICSGTIYSVHWHNGWIPPGPSYSTGTNSGQSVLHNRNNRGTNTAPRWLVPSAPSDFTGTLLRGTIVNTNTYL